MVEALTSELGTALGVQEQASKAKALGKAKAKAGQPIWGGGGNSYAARGARTPLLYTRSRTRTTTSIHRVLLSDALRLRGADGFHLNVVALAKRFLISPPRPRRHGRLGRGGLLDSPAPARARLEPLACLPACLPASAAAPAAAAGAGAAAKAGAAAAKAAAAAAAARRCGLVVEKCCLHHWQVIASHARGLAAGQPNSLPSRQRCSWCASSSLSLAVSLFPRESQQSTRPRS